MPGHAPGASRDLAARLLIATRLVSLASMTLARRGRFALLLHGISSRKIPEVDREAQPHLTTEELADLLDWLKPRFAFLSPKDFLDGTRPGVLLTFDDGFANNFRQALPVLRSFSAPAVFFVTTQHVTDPCNWLGFVREQVDQAWGSAEAVPEEIAADWYNGMSIPELRACASDPLVTIGSHGVTHTVLDSCSREQLLKELVESKTFLEEVIGEPVHYFAYPKGEYDRRVLEETEAAGYSAAFVIDSAGLGGGHLELPRVGIYQVDQRYLSLKLSGLHRRPLPVRSRRVSRDHQD